MKIPASILSFILGCLLTYLIGAFISTSFNTVDWTPDGRFFCVMMSLVFGGIAALFTYLEMEKSK